MLDKYQAEKEWKNAVSDEINFRDCRESAPKTYAMLVNLAVEAGQNYLKTLSEK